MPIALAGCTAPEAPEGADPWNTAVHQHARGDGDAFREPYQNALLGVWNFGNCPGVEGSETLARLRADLRRFEEQAAAKGLRPILEEQRRRFIGFLERATMIQCAGGPEWSERKARRALRRFAEWVAEQ